MTTVAYFRVMHGRPDIAWDAISLLDITALTPPILVDECDEYDTYSVEIVNN